MKFYLIIFICLAHPTFIKSDEMPYHPDSIDRYELSLQEELWKHYPKCLRHEKITLISKEIGWLDKNPNKNYKQCFCISFRRTSTKRVAPTPIEFQEAFNDVVGSIPAQQKQYVLRELHKRLVNPNR